MKKQEERIDLIRRNGRIRVNKDITERKRGEKALKEALKELQERNEELLRFTYAVSHDLKSPLATILTFLGYLEQDSRKPDRAGMDKDFDYIRSAADKMSRLLDELLNLSRVGRIVNPSVETPLQDIVKEALSLVAGRIAESGVRIEITEEPIMLSGDRQRLVEVFQNLVDNALKFMGRKRAPRVEIGVEQAGAETVFFVRDNGIGIDPLHQPKLFSLFEKLDPNTEGTGIGLAIVRRIVEGHGGRIWVESAGPGKGATFRFTLAQTRRQPRQGGQTMSKGQPVIILLVEDDRAHAEIVQRNLKDVGVANRIVHVEDGQAALDYLGRRGAYADPAASPRPHLILLDLRLPKVDGLEVLRRIKADADLKGIPTVVLTTSSAESDMINAYSNGAGSYLVKPADFKTFAKLLAALGFYWLAWNKFPT